MNIGLTRYRVLAIAVAISSLVGVPFFLMYSDIIGRSIQSVARLGVGPAFSGGKIVAVFHDPVGDDHGYGGLRYPATLTEDGSLDLVRYTVHQPVRGSFAPGMRDYWQLDFSFRTTGRDRNIRVYFAQRGAKDGSTQTRVEFAEGIEFAQGAPWQFALCVRGDSGTIESFDGSFKAELGVIQSRARTDLSVRIPLSDPALRFLYDLPALNQYILVGALDPAQRDGFADVDTSDFIPKIYDVLVPEGATQEETLSAWSEEEFRVPVLEPITVRLEAPVDGKKKGKGNDPESLARLEELNKAADAETERENAAALALYDSKPSAERERAIAAFNAGKIAEAEALFDAILAKDGESVEAMAYKGSLVALRGSEAQPLEAVVLIKEAYGWLDRAVSKAASDEELVTACLNRANVSMAIPETVFGKAEEGGDDFLKASEGIRRLIGDGSRPSDYSTEDIVHSMFGAARCYEIAGDANKAETWYLETKRLLDGIDPSLCSKERLGVFRHFEIGPDETVVAGGEKSPDGKAGSRDSDGKSAADGKKRDESELKATLEALKASPDDLALVETALRLQVMNLDRIKDALKLGERNESLIADSMIAQLYIAVAECKMATKVKKTVDKVDWINKGMRRFDKTQRRWPNDETVYTYQALTYSYFPSEMGMYEQVLDLIDAMRGNYLEGQWPLTEKQADFIRLIFSNLEGQYPNDPENGAIRAKAKQTNDELETMGQRPLTAEAAHE